MDADKAELQQLADIDENLIRANLMPAEERRTSEECRGKRSQNATSSEPTFEREKYAYSWLRRRIRLHHYPLFYWHWNYS
jgi:hypothetical protein